MDLHTLSCKLDEVAATRYGFASSLVLQSLMKLQLLDMDLHALSCKLDEGAATRYGFTSLVLQS
jgi:hypothetical protein